MLNTLRLNFCFLKIIRILPPHYYPKAVGHILIVSKCVCVREITLLINHNEHADENEKLITYIRHK